MQPPSSPNRNRFVRENKNKILILGFLCFKAKLTFASFKTSIQQYKFVNLRIQ